MKLINYDEVDEKLDGLYNHPSDADMAAFAKEYGSVVEQLAETLESIGSVSIDDSSTESDFYMVKWDVHTRSIVVVSSSPTVLSKKLIKSILEGIESFPEKYRIVLDGRLSHGDSFYIFIDPEEVCGWFRNPEKVSTFE